MDHLKLLYVILFHPLSRARQTISHKVTSNGPYLSSVFYKIIQPTVIHILWKKYKGLKKDKTKSVWDWENEYHEIDLGKFKIERDTISASGQNSHMPFLRNEFSKLFEDRE